MPSCRSSHSPRSLAKRIWARAYGWVALLLILPGSAFAVPTLQEYFRETWTTRAGLPHNLVVDIEQTPDGYLWFATWEGAVRYNGRDFAVFDRTRTGVLPDSGLRALYLEDDGGLLIGGARGGLARVKDGEWSAFPAATGLINDVLRDRQGRLWAATDGFGLYRLDADGSSHVYLPADGLPGQTVYALAEDDSGRVWLATSAGLAWFADEQIQTLGNGSELARQPILSLLAVPSQGLLIGTDTGVYRRQGDEFELLHPDLSDVAVMRMLADRAGSIWLGTVDQGLMRLSQHGLERLGVSQGLPNNRVLALYEDREDSIWVGTNGGLFRLRDAPFSTYTRRDGLPDSYVRSVLQGRHGVLWIGTSGGLAQLDSKGFRAIGAGTELADQSVLSLAEDAQGGLWVGTYSNGLMYWRDGQLLRSYQRQRGLLSNEVRAILPARDGTVWIGTASGLARIGADGMHTSVDASTLPGAFVMSLLQTSDGAIYAGTSDGLRRIDPPLAEEIDPPLAEEIDLRAMDGAEFVFAIHEDASRGELWLATDRCLVRYRLADGSLAIVGRRAGLPFDKFLSVVADQDGHFWLSSNRGVLRLAQADAIAIADGTQERIEYDLFGESDGMASAQCNGSSSPSASLRDDGSVWVATAGGLSTVKPERLPSFAARVPPAIIEGLRIDGEDWALAESPVRLPADSTRIELRFAGLGYVVPERIRFRYRLRGLDERWIERGTQNEAVFTYLPPGAYEFEVQAAYPHGAWSEHAARLKFSIAAQPWQHPAFWLATLLLAAALVYLAIRWRLRMLSETQNRLRRLVDERTQALQTQADDLLALNEEKSQLYMQLQQQAAAFERQAREDGLTGLPNRRAFDAELAAAFQQALQDQQPLCLAVIDIDHFKRINDEWSHTAGDQAIIAVAHAMRDRVRASDMLCRWGGEEFALLMPMTELPQARLLCERLRQSVAGLDCSQIAPGLRITISAGVCAHLGLRHHERLLSRADAALSVAKQSGRNRVCS